MASGGGGGRGLLSPLPVPNSMFLDLFTKNSFILLFFSQILFLTSPWKILPSPGKSLRTLMVDLGTRPLKEINY